jgi:hypothetical protein
MGSTTGKQRLCPVGPKPTSQNRGGQRGPQSKPDKGSWMSWGANARAEDVIDEILETCRQGPERASPGVPIDAKGGDRVV